VAALAPDALLLVEHAQPALGNTSYIAVKIAEGIESGEQYLAVAVSMAARIIGA
jgi:hypothetical protein